jgi:hypothetical protein
MLPARAVAQYDLAEDLFLRIALILPHGEVWPIPGQPVSVD